MRVYLTPPQPDRGLERIATALRRYAPPEVRVNTFPRNADLTIIYAIGRRDAIQRQCEEILSRGKKYAIVQVCLRSTMAPDTRDWFGIWRNAAVVWSYYDLQRAIAIDVTHGKPYLKLTNFYHTPLGADSTIFYDRQMSKDFIIATSGTNRMCESIRECALAAAKLNKLIFHLGPAIADSNAICANGISDDELAHRYSSCEFVSGLRRTEGFELPAVEGLLCGARPIVFDTPDYRWNYGNHAVYIPEGSREEVIDSLVQLFKHGPVPVSEEEHQQAVERYNWKTIISGFWERVL